MKILEILLLPLFLIIWLTERNQKPERLFGWKKEYVEKGGYKIITPNPPETPKYKSKKWGTAVPRK